MTNQSKTPQPVLTDAEIMRSAINASDSLNITRFHGMGAPSRTIMDDAGLLELGRAIETAVLSKLRAPVADERISLRDAMAMSVRLPDDYSAKWGEALLGEQAPNSVEPVSVHIDWWMRVEAAYRYRMADAMLKAREGE